jgi:hypothetical protein
MSAVDLPTTERIVGPLSAPSQADLMLLQTQLTASRLQLLDYSTRGLNNSPNFPTGQQGGGFIGDSLMVTPTASPSGQIIVQSGVGLQTNPSPQQNVTAQVNGNNIPIPGLDDFYGFSPISLNSPLTFTVPTADPSNPRIDLVEVKVNRYATDSTTLLYLTDPVNGVWTPGPGQQSLTWDVGAPGPISTTPGSPIVYKTGTPAGSPTIPTVDSGYVPLALVSVPASATTFNWSSIIDLRRMLLPNNALRVRVEFLLSWTGYGTSTVPSVSAINIAASPGVAATVSACSNIGANVAPQAAIVIKLPGTVGTWQSVPCAPSLSCCRVSPFSAINGSYLVRCDQCFNTGVVGPLIQQTTADLQTIAAGGTDSDSLTWVTPKALSLGLNSALGQTVDFAYVHVYSWNGSTDAASSQLVTAEFAFQQVE